MKINRKSRLSRPVSRPVRPLLLLGAMLALSLNITVNAEDGTDRASSRATSVKRDPFWPVGYQPEWLINAGKPKQDKALVASGTTDWNEAMKKVVIKGVSSRAGSEFFAVINGQIKSVGETFSIRHDEMLYTWMVDSISPPRSVKLRRVSAQ